MRNKEKEREIIAKNKKCSFGPLQDMKTAAEIMGILSEMLSVEDQKCRIIFEYDPAEGRYYIYQE